MTIHPRERSAYISDLSLELAEMARQDGHHTLAYLLSLAGIEAERLSSGEPSLVVHERQTARFNGNSV